jgi:hypothetical protein
MLTEENIRRVVIESPIHGPALFDALQEALRENGEMKKDRAHAQRNAEQYRQESLNWRTDLKRERDAHEIVRKQRDSVQDQFDRLWEEKNAILAKLAGAEERVRELEERLPQYVPIKRVEFIEEKLAAMTKERDALKSELALLPTNHVDYTEQIANLTAALGRTREKVNTPEVHDFVAGVEREAAHQRERWGDDHDKAKTPEDWLWALAFLATKATQAARYGDREKYLHHIITAAAMLANWHRLASLSPLSALEAPKPVPMVLFCPNGHAHVDEGEWATKPHKTHRCERRCYEAHRGPDSGDKVCGLEWRPANFPTVGVRSLEAE